MKIIKITITAVALLTLVLFQNLPLLADTTLEPPSSPEAPQSIPVPPQPPQTPQSSMSLNNVDKTETRPETAPSDKTVTPTPDKKLSTNQAVPVAVSPSDTPTPSSQPDSIAQTPTPTPSGIQTSNTGNGAGSSNTSSITSSETTNTAQTSSADVSNNLKSSSQTGQNNTSYNVGNSTIQTSAANTSGEIVSGINTNLANVSVSEFNVMGNQNGNLVLDFSKNCVLSCTASSSSTNSGNGSGSNNNSSIQNTLQNNSFQGNTATVGNNLILSADSGHNNSSYNTGGDSAIKTGDANVSGSALTLANNNLAGQVILGVVNIFGNLAGDIVLPDNLVLPGCTNFCSGTTAVTNASNGADSSNSASVKNTSDNNLSQTNNVDITNNLNLSSTTGNNQTSENTSGDSNIQTGTSNIVSKVLNISNLNISSGDIWLVLVNNAGQWVGQILGAPADAIAAVSSGGISISPDGSISVGNSQNGTGSQNNSSVNQSDSSQISQNNNTKLVNNINLSASTGGNVADYNTGGNSAITTGDANVLLNLINLVNNNVAVKGRLIITVVNVFGSWMGNFVTPGNPDSTKHASGQSSSSNDSSSSGSSSVSTVNQSIDSGNLVIETGNVPNKNPLVAATNLPKNDTGDVEGIENKSPFTLKSFAPSDSKMAKLNFSSNDSDQSININLAWLLTLAPVGLISLGISKALELLSR